MVAVIHALVATALGSTVSLNLRLTFATTVVTSTGSVSVSVSSVTVSVISASNFLQKSANQLTAP